MSDPTHHDAERRPIDETVELERNGDDATVSLPGQSGHHAPGSRARLVDEVVDDPRVKEAKHVTMAVPRGDHEALLQAQHRLKNTQTRSAGASVILDSDGCEEDRPPDEP
jgi:hypothetical protein